MEACGQHVHEKAADELVCRERHHLIALAPFEPVVLPVEGDAFLVACEQAPVGDGHTVGIAGEVAQDLLGSCEGSFAVNHPLAVAQRRQISREGSRICQRSVPAEELELPGAVSGGELLQDQPAEQAREHTDVEEKVGSAGDPARTIERDAAARHDHMDMRMVIERRAPGMEDREHTDTGAEVLGIGRDGNHGLGRGLEQDVVDRGLVLVGDVGDFGRQREHDVEVRHRQ